MTIYTSSLRLIKLPDNCEFDWKIPLKERVEGSYEPNVYVIKEVSTGRIYIGSRTKNGCKDSDIGNKYFTSCNAFKREWKMDKTLFEVVDVFKCESNRSSFCFESFLLDATNAVKDEEFFNKSNQGLNFNNSGIKTSNKQKIAAANSNKRREWTKEQRMKISKSQKDIFSTEENRKKYSKLHEIFLYKILTPFNKIEETSNLSKYAEDNNICRQHIMTGGYKNFILVGKTPLYQNHEYYGKDIAPISNKRYWLIEQPNGNVIEIFGLKEYAIQHNLNSCNLSSYRNSKGHKIVWIGYRDFRHIDFGINLL